MSANVGTMSGLARDEALALLATVPVGRVVFTRSALPAIRPVNFIVDDGEVVIRTREGSTLLAAVAGSIVAFEADEVGPDDREAWSVIVTGPARLVTEPRDIHRLRGLLTPWPALPERDCFIRIRPGIVSGRRIVRKHERPGPVAS